jgi:hypothetical protein
MTVGECWIPQPLSGDPKEMTEHLALVDGTKLPPGVAMAAELMAEGADWAYDVECFGGTLTLRNHRAECVARLRPRWRNERLFDGQESPGPAAFVATFEPLLRQHGRVGGFPDVVGARGTSVIMREMKVRGRDRLNRNQHAFAQVAQGMLGKRLDLAVVEWD